MLAAFLASPKRAQFGCELPGPDGTPCGRNPSLKRARNCRGRHGEVRLEFFGRVFSECPMGVIEREPWIVEAWEEFVFFKSFGALPKAGGLDDQSAWLVEAMLAIEQEVARIGANISETEHGKRFGRGKPQSRRT